MHFIFYVLSAMFHLLLLKAIAIFAAIVANSFLIIYQKY